MSDSDELQGIIGGVDPEALQALMVSMPNASITSMYEGFLSMGEADKASIRAMGVDVESIQQSILTNPDLVESTREVAKNISPKDIAAAMKSFSSVTSPRATPMTAGTKAASRHSATEGGGGPSGFTTVVVADAAQIITDW